MTSKRIAPRLGLVLGFGLGLVLALAGSGCKSDDTNEGNGGGAGTGNNDVDAGGGNGGTTFGATLLDPQTMVEVPGTEVQALNNADGEPLGKKATSDANGKLSFEDLPAGKVGFLAKGKTGATIDTYQFNIDSDADAEQLWVVAKSTAMIVPQLAGFTPDKDKASISGAVYWVNDAGEEEIVGCATVSFDAGGGEPDIRYFDGNNLPTMIDLRADTNPLNGRYFVGNAPVGVQTVTVMIGGKAMGTTSLPLFARKDASDGEDNVCISNIYIEADKNPTPAGCE